MPILGSVEYSVLLTTVYIINLPIIIIYTTKFVKTNNKFAIKKLLLYWQANGRYVFFCALMLYTLLFSMCF